ncbi:hypothetical protein TEA_020834 [Camellia sinensis var. sinensis]|uniref:Peptidyl-prolyl cis-trans isomerase n=1 Tax=Camellia sinensis var. sinensis TaxID=542762 RepID=A0A4V6RYP0_CAMSN|nr:hypothetical protein TEA_020834 [Camellia sinensis var. sinensis]
MSVLIVTSLGDIVVDLHTDLCPLTTKNFLKLCKIKYYNGCLFHTVQKDFTAQTGDPTGTGTGGDSIYKFLYGDQACFFGDEIRLELKHAKMGTVAMPSAGEDLNASQVFGEIAEGHETLQRINEAYVDDTGRPYKNIHSHTFYDPFDDPSQLSELIPDASPEGKPKDEVENDVRLEDDWVPIDEQLGASELEEILCTKDAHSSAVVLESIGDIPDADIKPPDNVLFVCKLNPVTEDEDLHTIFSRFGTVTSAEVIRDYKTGDSLCYAFIGNAGSDLEKGFSQTVSNFFTALAKLNNHGCQEFETNEACEQAYFKMDNALIDDRRIHVDFSQSVSKLWSQYRRRDSQMAKGKGCFKCGAPDHIAKDCTGDPSTKQQPPKYTLKEDNNQRGGDDNSRYEMVFDEDTARSPQREKKRRDYEIEDNIEKRKDERRSSEDLKQREYENSRDRQRHSDRIREYRDHERNRESRTSQSSGSQRDYKYHEERRDGEKYTEKRGHKDDSRRDDREYKKRNEDEREYRKRSVDNDSRGSGRDDEGHKRLNVDNHRRDKRDELNRLGDRDRDRDRHRRH